MELRKAVLAVGIGLSVLPFIQDGSAQTASPSRCQELRARLGSALINCWDFETPDQVRLHLPSEPGLGFDKAVVHDTAVAASGRGSMKFETISVKTVKQRYPKLSNESALWLAKQSNTRAWSRNFADDWSATFGSGDEFWIQFRAMENEAFYRGFGGDGPKKIIIGSGDRWVEYRSALREALPANASRGALIKLGAGQSVADYPNLGVVSIGKEIIHYQGRDVAQNALKVLHRGYQSTPTQSHAVGAATVVEHAAYSPGCTDVGVVITSGWDHVPVSYHSCRTKDHKYEGHYLPVRAESDTVTVDTIVQSGQKGRWNDKTKKWEGGCSLAAKKSGNYAGCVRDGPNQWVTWTIQVVGGSKWYRNDQDYRHDGTIRVWRNDKLVTDLSPNAKHPRSDGPSAAQCRAMSRSIVDATRCLSGYDWSWGYTNINTMTSLPMSPSDIGARWGKLHLFAMSWGRKNLSALDPILCCHDPAVRWYDDVVVSRKDPGLPDGRSLIALAPDATLVDPAGSANEPQPPAIVADSEPVPSDFDEPSEQEPSEEEGPELPPDVTSPPTEQPPTTPPQLPIAPQTQAAVEYRNAVSGHYFVAASSGEISALDSGAFAGWTRTGESFLVYALDTPGASNVCRFFSTRFTPNSSHFYTPFQSECDLLKLNADWQFEAQVFAMALPDSAGNCPAGTTALYRMFNNGRSGAPNHRYTTSAGTRSEMLAQGWMQEGYGATGVIGCVPM